MKRITLFLLWSALAFGQCGVERFQIKTLADKEASKIDPVMHVTTIEALRQLQAPDDLKHVPDHRHKPVEFTRYQVRAQLLGFKRESDKDLHLVLASLDDKKITMIAEIPAEECVPPSNAVHDSALQSWMIKTFGPKSGKMAAGHMIAVTPSVVVVVEGVGFFDFLHGQTGVAPNGIELHPVTNIVKGAQ